MKTIQVLINFLSFACNSFDYIKMSKKLHAKSADFLGFKLEFSVLSVFIALSFLSNFQTKSPDIVLPLNVLFLKLPFAVRPGLPVSRVSKNAKQYRLNR